ncbi:Glyoxalase/Bleomycin resistance protein/Dioxygenase superfamily protein [Enhydrobacter aerosaccus]|uniref:Glyoxalase/Bleomycin resistance protein/Dioxygenase superfamily protein n=1 Tax=Enhydrobacter aerosaccus TaxID=225324 RepID=A0A1T4KG56_9HYPH|nr:VOC family protein [Enhydrobacter aerosaccus]SJZ41428.1 Glyoxalase/Bleomycin resistance protein/Dioxygenase superfamily protein [Enhydrobacter aerosaccus]
MPKAINAQLTHFGLHATNIGRMVDFYTDTLGFVISDRGRLKTGNQVVFMTQSADCHHQFVLFDGRPEEMPYNPVNQISFHLDSLDHLKAYRQALTAAGVIELRQTDHGNAWAFYFKDPEGNTVEMYCDTPFHTPQPCGEPLDLDLSNSEIEQRTEAMCRQRPGFMTREAWMQGIQAKLDARP